MINQNVLMSLIDVDIMYKPQMLSSAERVRGVRSGVEGDCHCMKKWIMSTRLRNQFK